MILQWVRFRNLRRLESIMDYEQRVRIKTKPATKTNGNDERENATTGVSKLLQQEQFAEEF